MNNIYIFTLYYILNCSGGFIRAIKYDSCFDDPYVEWVDNAHLRTEAYPGSETNFINWWWW